MINKYKNDVAIKDREKLKGKRMNVFNHILTFKLIFKGFSEIDIVNSNTD